MPGARVGACRRAVAALRAVAPGGSWRPRSWCCSASPSGSVSCGDVTVRPARGRAACGCGARPGHRTLPRTRRRPWPSVVQRLAAARVAAFDARGPVATVRGVRRRQLGVHRGRRRGDRSLAGRGLRARGFAITVEQVRVEQASNAVARLRVVDRLSGYTLVDGVGRGARQRAGRTEPGLHDGVASYRIGVADRATDRRRLTNPRQCDALSLRDPLKEERHTRRNILRACGSGLPATRTGRASGRSSRRSSRRGRPTPTRRT